MNSRFLIKLLVVLPAILMLDYVLMTILGCTSCLFGTGDDFYCGTYCKIGKILLGLSGLFFLYLIFPDIKAMIKSVKDGKA